MQKINSCVSCISVAARSIVVITPVNQHAHEAHVLSIRPRRLPVAVPEVPEQHQVKLRCVQVTFHSNTLRAGRNRQSLVL
jgi:hypothetical protein